jgi:NADH dehydrogenase
MLACLQKMLPVIFLARPRARFQPVYVEDVAAALVASLANLDAYGQTYDLCGPRAYTLRELVALVGRLTGHRRPVIGLGDTLSYLQALTLELLPGRLMTRDNYRSMQVDNVSDQPFPFGIHPAALEAEVPTWLAAASPRARYRAYRDRARRAS